MKIVRPCSTHARLGQLRTCSSILIALYIMRFKDLHTMTPNSLAILGPHLPSSRIFFPLPIYVESFSLLLGLLHFTILSLSCSLSLAEKEVSHTLLKMYTQVTFKLHIWLNTSPVCRLKSYKCKVSVPCDYFFLTLGDSKEGIGCSRGCSVSQR